MHKKIVSNMATGFILVVLAMAGCRTTRPLTPQHQPHQPVYAQKMNVNGPVKSIISRYYKAQTTSTDSIAKGRYILKRVYTFDKQGNKLSEATYDVDGTKDLDYTYQYDKARRLIDEEKKQIGKSYHEHFSYSYDENGRLKEKRALFPDTVRTIYSYEDNGRHIIQKSYDTEGDFYFKQVQDYKNALLTEEKSYSVLNTDEKNELILTTHTVYHYDKNRNRTQEQEFKPSGEVDRTTIYTYDEHGNIIQKAYQHGDEDVSVLFKNRYRYNARQNWIGKVEYVKGKPDIITEREITYFE